MMGNELTPQKPGSFAMGEKHANCSHHLMYKDGESMDKRFNPHPFLWLAYIEILAAIKIVGGVMSRCVRITHHIVFPLHARVRLVYSFLIRFQKIGFFPPPTWGSACSAIRSFFVSKNCVFPTPGARSPFHQMRPIASAAILSQQIHPPVIPASRL